NPLLFLVGLGGISPLVYFLIVGFRSESTVKDIVSGIITGIIALIICLLFLFIQIVCIGIFFILINPLQDAYWSFYALNILSLFLFFIFMSCGLLFYQRVWYYLVLQGLKIDLSFRERLSLTNNYASESQLRFIGLIILHVIIQILLTIWTNPSVEPEAFRTSSYYSPLYDVNPLTFLILTIFEVGFYMVFILYPIVQLANYKQPIRGKNLKLSLVQSREINTLKRKTKTMADIVLKKEGFKRFVNIKEGFKIFVEEVQGYRVLFLEENIPSDFPVALNYSHLWPKKTVQLNQSINAIVTIPNLDQMKKFLQVIEKVNF
ncbi:MAG: hypothetical protein ACFFAU_11700, partial [Candidatus Hodarchaeota archaeon]